MLKQSNSTLHLLTIALQLSIFSAVYYIDGFMSKPWTFFSETDFKFIAGLVRYITLHNGLQVEASEIY